MKCLVISFQGLSFHYFHHFLMLHYYHWVQTDMIEFLQCYPLPLHPNMISTSLGFLLQPSLHSFPAFNDVAYNRAHKQEVSWQEAKSANLDLRILQVSSLFCFSSLCININLLCYKTTLKMLFLNKLSFVIITQLVYDVLIA